MTQDKPKRELSININLDLKEGFYTVYESTIRAKSFQEAREMLDQAEKLMTIAQPPKTKEEEDALMEF